jgi:hypothetical protein
MGLGRGKIYVTGSAKAEGAEKNQIKFCPHFEYRMHVKIMTHGDYVPHECF